MNFEITKNEALAIRAALVRASEEWRELGEIDSRPELIVDADLADKLYIKLCELTDHYDQHGW
jgi:hypothetical protein